MPPPPPGSGMSPPLSGRQRVLVRGALLLGALGLVATTAGVLIAFPPTATSFYPKCLSYQLLGIHCPGCGVTRAAHSLLVGRPVQALAYNPLLVVLAPVLLLAAARAAWFWLWGTAPRRELFAAWSPWLLLAVFFAYWVLRNVPVYPFTLLAPHETGW